MPLTIDPPARSSLPSIERLTAPNPSAYTSTGTQTYVVGRERVIVIDPGPESAEHLAAMRASIGGRRVSAILVTHNHRDHSPGARALADATGAPILGGPPVAADRSFDSDYRPDRILKDGDTLAVDGATLAVLATPGHTSNHLCFALQGTGTLFTGDHAMGWSTSVVMPPDGDMGAYMESLERLAGRDDRIYYPGHGDAIDDPARWLRATIGHRRLRENQILKAVGERAADVDTLVPALYPGLQQALHGAAAQTVLAHLLDLERRGQVERQGAAWRRID